MSTKRKRDKRARRKIALPIKRAAVFKDKRTKRLRTRQAKQNRAINES